MIARATLAGLLIVAMTTPGHSQDPDPKAKDAPGASSGQSAQRTAELKKTLERRTQRRKQSSAKSAQRAETSRARDQELARLRAEYEAELAQIRHSQMTAEARNQAIIDAQQRRIRQLGNAETYTGAGTSGQAVALTGKVSQPDPANVGFQGVGTTLRATDGNTYELDLSLAALTLDEKRQLEGKSIAIEGLLTLRESDGVLRRVVYVTKMASTTGAGRVWVQPGHDQPRRRHAPGRRPRDPRPGAFQSADSSAHREAPGSREALTCVTLSVSAALT